MKFEQWTSPSGADSAADTKAFPVVGFMRLPQILAIFPVSKSTWWQGVKTGRYPPSVKLSARVTAWRADEIQKLLQKGD